MSHDDLKVIFEVVAHGDGQEKARQRLSRNRTTLNRAYNVVAEFERRNLAEIDDATAREIAEAAKYSTTTSYVQGLFLRWRAWREAGLSTSSRGAVSEGASGPVQVSRYDDPELGPHSRGVFYFGQRFRDLANVPSPDDVGKTATEGYRRAMWQGQRVSLDDAGIGYTREEERVAVEWSFLWYDARQHSLFPAFQQHLSGHLCWERLGNMEAAFNEYIGSCHETYAAVLDHVRGRLPSVSEDKAKVLAETLLVDGFHRKRGGPGINFSCDVLEARQEGLPRWELKLGAWVVRADDPAELRTFADVHQQLRASSPYAAELTTLVEKWSRASGAVGAFQAILNPDDRLRKLVLNGRCEWCL